MSDGPTVVYGFVVFVVLVGIYFAPSIVAFEGKHRDRVAIAVLNIFLGWTFVGWVIALVWAFKK